MLINESNFKIVHQGIDTLVIGVLATDKRVFETSFFKFVQKVKKAKEQAQSIKAFGEKFVKSDFDLGFGDFLISSKGIGNYFGFCKNDDVFFSVADTKFETKGLYHIKLQFRSIYLLKYGHKNCINQVKSFLNAIFGNAYVIRVLRLDLCCDVTGIKYTPIDFFNFRSLKKVSTYTDSVGKSLDDDLLDNSEKETRIISLDEINISNFMRFNRFEGISFGKSPRMFRVYDKIKQIGAKNISSLIFTRWQLNGFDIERDMFVFRHEAEFGRSAIKSLIPLNCKDELKFITHNLGSFWLDGLKICRWYDLTDSERNKIHSNALLSDSVRKIYQRASKDKSRFDLWARLEKWHGQDFNELSKHDIIKSQDLSQAKKALKAFISAVYVNLGANPHNFITVLDEVKKDLEFDGISLHEYGLSKLAGSFSKNEKIINDCGLDENNPLLVPTVFALDQFIIALSQIKDGVYKSTIKEAIYDLKGLGVTRGML